MSKFNRIEIKLCECGCGQPVRKIKHRFVHGHNARNHSEEVRKRISETSRKRWEDPKYKESTINTMRSKSKEISLSLKKFYQTEGNKERIIKGRKEKCVYEKISAAIKERWDDPIFAENHRGKNASNWQGGKSYLNYPKVWNNHLKREIRKRDNYACRKCGIKEGELKEKLHVHHIDYNKNNCSNNNLISLCRKCHMKTNVSSFNRYYMYVLFSHLLKYGIDPNENLSDETVSFLKEKYDPTSWFLLNRNKFNLTKLKIDRRI